VPLVPNLVRVAWLVLSTQGFRSTVQRIAWDDLADVYVTGLPMCRRLVMVHQPPEGEIEAGVLVIAQASVQEALEQVAAAILIQRDPTTRSAILPSWGREMAIS
jgi:hypothetical protein